MALPFKRIMSTPYNKYLGQRVRVTGAWWPGTSGVAAKKQYTLLVLEHGERTVGQKTGRAFKMLLEFDGDNKLNRDPDVDLIDGTDYWWVPKDVLEENEHGDYFKTLDDNKQRLAKENEAEKEQAEAEIQRNLKPKAAPTPLQKAKSEFDMLFSTSTELEGGAKITLYRCLDPGCSNRAPWKSKGGEKRNPIKHAKDHHPQRCIEVGLVKEGVKPTEPGSSHDFDDAKSFAINMKMVKLMDHFNLPENFGESDAARDFAKELES